MKVQFKYAFLAGVRSARGITFGITAGMMIVFIALGVAGVLPTAALITAVALGGCGIAAMMIVNIMNDIVICSRMFTSPGAFFYTLTPAHRGKMLIASVVTMMVLDIVSMAAVIFGETWLSLMLAGGTALDSVVNAMQRSPGDFLLILWALVMLVGGYMLIISIILFTVTMRKSLLYQKPASGLLAFLCACGCFYVFSLLQVILLPFGSGQWYGPGFYIITLGGAGIAGFTALMFIAAAALFVVTGRLMERKLSI